jgi:hypothetical protein
VHNRGAFRAQIHQSQADSGLQVLQIGHYGPIGEERLEALDAEFAGKRKVRRLARSPDLDARRRARCSQTPISA